MKNLLKIFSVMACLMGVGAAAHASNYVIPADNNGRVPGDPGLVGVEVIDSTGTQSYGLLAPAFLYWVAVSSESNSNYAVLRDTATHNTTSNIALTLQVGTNTNASTTVINFDPPVIFRNGISINLAGVSTGRWMFGIRRRLDAKIGTDPTAGTSASD